MVADLTRWLRGHVVAVVYLAVVTVALALLVYGEDKQRRTSQAACVRGNLIRAQVDYNSGVIRGLIVEAAAARDLLADLHERQGDLDAARIERTSATKFRALLEGFRLLGPAPCDDLYRPFFYR